MHYGPSEWAIAASTLIGAVVSAIAILVNLRQARINGVKIHSIDTAVNGAAEGEPSIRQNVETLTERSVP